MNFWQEILDRPREVYAKLSRGQRVGVLALASIGLVVAVLSCLLAGRQSFVVLYGNLEPADENEIITKLGEMGVPYQLTAGARVEVPEERVHEVRMRLGVAGLPRTASPLWEQVGKSQFGFTDNQFNSIVQRALQDDLEDMIETSPEVRKATVKLHLEPPGLYANAPSRAGGTVTLALRPGMALADSQAAGIALSIARCVGIPKAEDVIVVDSAFHQLFPRADDGDPLTSLAHLQKTQAIEHHLEEKAESMLRPVCGDRAVVRVNVELDPSYTEKALERVAEDNKVPVKTSKTQEPVSSDGGGTGGARGATPPTLATVQEENEYHEGVEKSLEIVAAGQIRHLSVSLLLDEGDPVLAAKQQEISDTVKNAVGFVEGSTKADAKGRKDSFKLALVKFETPAAPEPMASPFAIENLLPLAGHLAEAVTVVFVLLLLAKVLRGGSKSRPAKTKSGAAVKAAKAGEAKTRGGGDDDEGGDELSELVMGSGSGDDLRTRLARFVTKHPDHARDVLVAWLKEEVVT